MDDLSRSALIRAATTFVVVVVAGATLVYGANRIGGLSSSSSSSPTPTPSASVSPGPPATPVAWLAWVPGGMPPGFGESLTAIPAIDDATTATADIAWLTASQRVDGTTVDDPPSPYMIPIDTTGVEPSFASFLPQPERREVYGLQPGEGILSESEAQLRGLGRGATLTFDGTVDVKVLGTLPDPLMGGYELLVDRATGKKIGVTHERYVLFHVRPTVPTSAAAMAQKMQPYLPLGVPYPVVEVRSPGETTYLRANDGELPPVLLKRRFGEFDAYPDPAAVGQLQIDPTWVRDHIGSGTIPLLGPVTCNQKILGPLGVAMTQLETSGHGSDVIGAGQCFVATASPSDPDGPFTARPFGAAIDINPGSNRPGDPPDQSSRLVRLMSKAGFGWAGTDAYPQGSLFRFRGRPPTQD
jgi:hypothetical protein